MYQFNVNISLISTYFQNTCPVDPVCFVNRHRQPVTDHVIHIDTVQSLIISTDFLTEYLFILSVKANIIIADQLIRVL